MVETPVLEGSKFDPNQRPGIPRGARFKGPTVFHDRAKLWDEAKAAYDKDPNSEATKIAVSRFDQYVNWINEEYGMLADSLQAGMDAVNAAGLDLATEEGQKLCDKVEMEYRQTHHKEPPFRMVEPSQRQRMHRYIINKQTPLLESLGEEEKDEVRRLYRLYINRRFLPDLNAFKILQIAQKQFPAEAAMIQPWLDELQPTIRKYAASMLYERSLHFWQRKFRAAHKAFLAGDAKPAIELVEAHRKQLVASSSNPRGMREDRELLSLLRASF